VRRALRRTWGPFLGRFGRVTPVQAEAIPILLKGRSAVICAPTASGKTEAAITPLVERYLPAGDDRLRILYVVPTRALVNDLVRRLEGPLGDLRLTVIGKTGDRQALRKNEKPAVLVTTPESMDSLLCRRPDLFEALRAVVLDELHLLDGGYRGDQLRVLLERIPVPVQRVALSATVHDPQAMADRYLGPDAHVIQVGEARSLDMQIVTSGEEAVALCRAAKRHKILWFCNTRKDAETAPQELKAVWPPERILVHHGSLGRRERLSVERAMQEWPWGLCVATMTLEIGIDIGDVDAVVLDRPPLTPSAFMQRIGRACRRESRIFVVGVSRDEVDEADFDLLAELAAEGEVEPKDAEPDLSVAVQQVLSILFGAPAGIARSEVERLVEPLAPGMVLQLILGHLESEGWLVQGREGTLRATTTLMDAGAKGTIHGNIPDMRERTLRDAATGQPIASATAALSVGDTVVLAGKARRVLSIGKSGVELGRASSGTAPAFRARRSGGGWRWLLPEELKK
jgi:ATP-dependent Lhr-like helicase